MKNTLFVLALSCLMLLSCQKNEQKLVTAGGYEMEFLHDEAGEVGAVGEHILFNVKILAHDSLLLNTFDKNAKQILEVKPTEELIKQKDPIGQALGLMSKGDSALLYIPADSLNIPALKLKSGESIHYILKVYDILDEAGYNEYTQEIQKQREEEMRVFRELEAEVGNMTSNVLERYRNNELGDELQKDESGMLYVVHELGEEAPYQVGELAKVDYYGALADNGQKFDSSFGRGQAFQFMLGRGQVIKGWDIAIAKFPRGSKVTIILPPDLAYGAAGSPPVIPENATLAFYIEIL